MYVVYVLNQDGDPLMPTTRFGKVRHLLNDRKAKVVSLKPFVIQLQYESTKYVQPLYGGTDPGRTNIGEAVLNQKGEVVYAAQVETRNMEIPKLMEKRAMHRRASRRGERLRKKRRAKKCGTTTEFPEGRKLPGFKDGVMGLKDIINSESRFNNRKRPNGWVTPTVTQLIRTHINLVNLIRKILPVTKWTIEYNKFAYMQIEDGTIRGIDFQKGRMCGYSSVNDYIYALQDGKCACCGNPIEHYHHLVPRHSGGSNLPENIVGLCKHCHEDVHKNNFKLDKIGERKKYAGISVLNTAMSRIYDGLVKIFGIDNVCICDGIMTKDVRESNNFTKDHYIDAVCIASIGANVIPNIATNFHYEIKQFRNHNRQRIHSQRERTYKYDKETIAKNRKPRFEQGKTLAMSTWYEKNVQIYGEMLANRMRSKVVAIKSQRRYNNLNRILPGVVFYYHDHRYVMTGQSSNGAYYRAYGEGSTNFPLSKCEIRYLNRSLTYL